MALRTRKDNTNGKRRAYVALRIELALTEDATYRMNDVSTPDTEKYVSGFWYKK
jgi:hypothetical protein